MAVLVLTNAKVLVNAVDLSDHVRQVTITYQADIQDKTAMGATAHARIGGLKDWSVDIEFNQDFAASNVDATLYSIVGTSIVVDIQPVNAARSATNPSYNGNAVLESYKPISGKVGDMFIAPVTLRGDGVLNRSIV
jgi:hypothetical protein